MAENTTIARPYSQAVFELARDTDALANWSDMLALMAAVAADPQMVKLVHSPHLTDEQLSQLFIDVCGDAVNPAGGNFLRLLSENGRLSVLPEIAGGFEEMCRKAEGTVQAELITAFPATDAQQTAVANALKEKFGREVKLECSTDSSLVGGAVIRAGDMVIDGSVTARLSSLATTLSH